MQKPLLSDRKEDELLLQSLKVTSSVFALAMDNYQKILVQDTHFVEVYQMSLSFVKHDKTFGQVLVLYP
jgi:hypothetical protein